MWEGVAVGLAGAGGGLANVLSQVIEEKNRTWRAILPSVTEVAVVLVGAAAGIAFWAVNNGGLNFDTETITAGHLGGAIIAGFGGVAYLRQLVAKRDEAKTADEAIAALDAVVDATRVDQEAGRT